MSLITARTTLRRVVADDVPALHALWTDPAVRKYLWDDTIITRERRSLLNGLDTVFYRLPHERFASAPLHFRAT